MSTGSSNDPAFKVCGLLLTKCSWTPNKISARLGVPAVVVEECLRTGRSNALLRRQLVNLVREGGEIPHEIPSSLLAQLLNDEDNDLDQDFAAQFDTASVGSGGGGNDAAMSAAGQTFAFLDEATREHFRYLQQSVGHNLFSIVNDPTADGASGSAKDQSWGGWLPFGGSSSKSSSSTHGGGAGGPVEFQGVGIQVDIAPETFSPYIGQVAPLRTANQLMVEADAKRAERAEQALESATRKNEESSDTRDSGDGEVNREDDFIFPNSVPLRFADKDFRVQEVFDTLLDDLSNLDSVIDQLEGFQSNVEFVLMMEVQTKSEEFFSASQSFSRLASDVEKARSGLSTTRGEVAHRGESITKGFLSIARRYREKEHHRMIIDKVQTLDMVQTSVVKAGSFINRHQYSKAVGLIDSALDASTTLIDLGVAQGLPGQLAVLKKQLYDGVSHELKKILHPAEWRSVQEAGAGGSSPTSNSHQSSTCCTVGGFTWQEWDRVEELLRTANHLPGCVAACLSGYTRSVAQHVGVVLDRAVKNNLEEKNMLQQARGAVNALSDDLYKMHVTKVPVKYFLADLLPFAEKTLRQHVRRCLSHVDALGTVVPLEQPWVKQHRSELYLSIQAALTKLLEARTSASGSEGFRQHHIEQLIRGAFTFISELEETLGIESPLQSTSASLPVGEAELPANYPKSAHATTAMTTAQRMKAMGKFRVTLLNQARNFIKKKHQEKQEHLMTLLNTQEQWTQQDKIDRTFQGYVYQLCEYDAESISRSRTIAVDYHGGGDGVDGGQSDLNGTGTTLPSGSGYHSALGRHSGESYSNNASLDAEHFDERLQLPGKGGIGYAVVDSLITLVQILAEYDHFLCTFPFLTDDVLQYMQQILKCYDGQCAALVLGGGAVASQTLESISVTHLAMGSQCVAFLEDLLPLMRKRLTALSEQYKSEFLSTFDRIERDLAEHRDQFLSKIVSVFQEKVTDPSSRFDDPVKNWTTRGNAWVVGLLKECIRLMKSIKPILSPRALNSVMWPCYAICWHLLREAMMDVDHARQPHLSEQIWKDVQLFPINVAQKMGSKMSEACMHPQTKEAYECQLPTGGTTSTSGSTAEEGISIDTELQYAQRFFGFPVSYLKK